MCLTVFLKCCRLVGLAWTMTLTSAAEIIMLFVGFTMFRRGLGAVQTVLHLVGLILVITFIDAQWSSSSLVAVFILFSLIPFLLESAMALIAVKFSLWRF